MIIDVHAHVFSNAFMAELARNKTFGIELMDHNYTYLVPGYGPFDPPIYHFEERIEGLASRGVDTQLVSPVPTLIAWPGGAPDVEWARRLNQSTADSVAQSQGRFRGLATLCLGEPDKAVDELNRALDTHGFVGVQIGTYGGDRPLDDASLDPLFSLMEKRGLIVFMHPTSTDKLERWSDYTLNTVLAWPNETTLAITRMIYGGVFERHPNLHLALAHGGGNLVFMRGRIDLGYTAPKYERNEDCHKNISRLPSSYYQQLFFDTAVGAPEMLRFLIQTAGADRVVYGSDEPFEIADPQGEMAMPTVRSLDSDTADAVLGGNLAAILDAQH